MNDSHESEKENMETTTRPSSLADVANAKVQKAPGTRAMVQDLKHEAFMLGLERTMFSQISI